MKKTRLHQYYIHSPTDYAFDWQYGYKQMVMMVKREEENYDKTVVTNYYDQPYIFFLFYGRQDPFDYISSFQNCREINE